MWDVCSNHTWERDSGVLRHSGCATGIVVSIDISCTGDKQRRMRQETSAGHVAVLLHCKQNQPRLRL